MTIDKDINTTNPKQGDTTTAHLLRLHESRELYDMAKAKTYDSRLQLTNLVSDLVQDNLTETEKDLVADILIDLTKQAYVEIRMALAEKLSTIAEAPQKLILELANDEINVARHVLEKSVVLADSDLLAIIQQKTALYWNAIAKRKGMGETIINALADTDDLDTFCTLAKNNNIEMTSYAFDKMGNLARTSETLAIPLLTRPDVPQDLAIKLYEHVGDALKSYIQDKFDKTLANNAVKDAVSAVVKKQSNVIPSEELYKEAIEKAQQGFISKRMVLRSLRHGKIRHFVAQFAALNNLDVPTTLKLLKEKTGRLLAHACHDQEIHRSDFVAIFLMTNKIRNSNPTVPLDNIQTAMQYYDSIKIKQARQVMETLRRDGMKL